MDDPESRDINPKTIKLFKEKILKAKTIFWSGPLGKIEVPRFQKGTMEIAKVIIKSNVFSVVGGGETVDFINNFGLADKFSHVSTGGSAMLAFLAGEKLPGIAILKKGNSRLAKSNQKT
jgi:phosphoglycerate kinase